MTPSTANSNPRPWYARGLRFSCQQSGHCCTGGPGYVWICVEEIGRLAQHLQLSSDAVIHRYCRRIGDRYSLNERQNPQGQFDCVFLGYEQREARPPRSLKVLHRKSICTIYSARPLQCRTWPFWDGTLASKDAWDRAAQRCPGINQGRQFSFDQIESLRTAPDWPPTPPASAQSNLENQKTKTSRP